MNGIENEPFFQATKKIKKERMKWISILLVSNMLNILLHSSDTKPEEAIKLPWQADWVEVSLEVEVIASGSLPLAVSLLNQHNQVIFSKAYVKTIEKKDYSDEIKQKTRLMISPNDLIKINHTHKLKALPYSKSYTLTKSAPLNKKVNYEIHF